MSTAGYFFIMMRIAFYCMGLVFLSGLPLFGLSAAQNMSIDNNRDKPVLSSCPSMFFNVAIIDSARQCQQFDDSQSDTLPATLVYFTHQPKEQVIAFYQQTYPSFITKAPVNQRTQLSATNGAVRIIVSPDDNGTQVDMLIVRPL